MVACLPASSMTFELDPMPAIEPMVANGIQLPTRGAEFQDGNSPP